MNIINMALWYGIFMIFMWGVGMVIKPPKGWEKAAAIFGWTVAFMFIVVGIMYL